MIKGIGTDILHLDRIRPVLQQENYVDDSFIRKVFTPKEIALAEEREIPLYFYATRFAGKEAVFKAINLSGGDDCRLNEIEILSDEYGKPYITLYGRAKALAEKKEISHILISLSYETDYAIAYVVAE